MLSTLKTEPKEETKGAEPISATTVKRSNGLHRISCEMKITKTWEAGDLEQVEEESSDNNSEDFETPQINDSPRTSPVLMKNVSKPMEPPEISKQKSKTRGATGQQKSEASVGVSNRKQTTFKVQVSKIEIGSYYQNSERTMCPHLLRVLYDAEEGFTIIGKPEEEAFI